MYLLVCLSVTLISSHCVWCVSDCQVRGHGVPHAVRPRETAGAVPEGSDRCE